MRSLSCLVIPLFLFNVIGMGVYELGTVRHCYSLNTDDCHCYTFTLGMNDQAPAPPSSPIPFFPAPIARFLPDDYWTRLDAWLSTKDAEEPEVFLWFHPEWIQNRERPTTCYQFDPFAMLVPYIGKKAMVFPSDVPGLSKRADHFRIELDPHLPASTRDELLDWLISKNPDVRFRLHSSNPCVVADDDDHRSAGAYSRECRPTRCTYLYIGKEQREHLELILPSVVAGSDWFRRHWGEDAYDDRTPFGCSPNNLDNLLSQMTLENCY